MRLVSKLAVAAAGSVFAAATAMSADAPPVVPAVVAAAAPPSPNLLLAGFADAWVGWRVVKSTEDPNGNHLAFGGNTAISIPFGRSFALQLDAQGERYRDFDALSPLGALLLGGHLSWRNPDRFLIGGFAAAARPFGDQMDNNNPGFYSGWGYILGAEMQAYLRGATLYVQGGYANIRTDFDGGPEGFVNGWFLRTVGRFFVNDDVMIEGEFAFGRTPCFIDGTCAPVEDAGLIYNWGVSAKFRITDTVPLYATIGYAGALYYATEDPDLGREHVFRIGLSMAFGAGTLFDNDRRGATLNLPMLPVRGAAWAAPLD